MKQANNSICCQVKLSPESEVNTPNITEVWTKVIVLYTNGAKK
jgi:hypothetical protein